MTHGGADRLRHPDAAAVLAAAADLVVPDELRGVLAQHLVVVDEAAGGEDDRLARADRHRLAELPRDDTDDAAVLDDEPLRDGVGLRARTGSGRRLLQLVHQQPAAEILDRSAGVRGAPGLHAPGRGTRPRRATSARPRSAAPRSARPRPMARTGCPARRASRSARRCRCSTPSPSPRRSPDREPPCRNAFICSGVSVKPQASCSAVPPPRYTSPPESALAPPGPLARSRTSTSAPAVAASYAADPPAQPKPTTSTSHCRSPDRRPRPLTRAAPTASAPRRTD